MNHLIAPLGFETDGDAEYPVLPGFRQGSTLLVWCAHEHVWHIHGTGDGHRASHCLCPSSPYYRRGYVVREESAMTLLVRRQHGRAARSGTCDTCGPAVRF